MGWTFTNKGSQTTREFFEKEFNYDKPDGRSGKILAFSATWTVAYMAYEVKVPAIDGLPAKTDVIGIVCLLRHVPRAADGYTFGYKDMSEEMGPNESRCPKSILDLLTPTTYEYALAWRQRCRERIEKKAKAPKIKSNDWVQFAQGITFRNGVTTDCFQWVRGSLFRMKDSGFCRISNWREREFQKLST
jgi:hypothetical protein